MTDVYTYQLTLNNLFVTALRNYGDREIVYRDKHYTYRQFFDRIHGLAAGLADLGVEQGDIVAVIDWDTIRYMEAYYTLPMMGTVMHTVNIRYPPELIYYTMHHAEDKYVIVRDEFVPILEKNKALFDFVKGWIIYSDEEKSIETTLSPSYNYNDLILKNKYEFPELNENTPATLFYTSGTTGMPKGVTFTHRNLFLHSLALGSVLQVEPLSLSHKDVFMTLVPMFHVHSWGIPYTAIVNGNKYVLPGRYEVSKLLELIKKERVTFSAMVPSILYMILNAPNVEEYREYLNGWKVVIGGAALPRGLALKAKSFGITAIGGYGLSETAPVLSIALFTDTVRNMPEDKQFDYMISTGIPITLVNLKVVDKNNQEVPWDGKTVGEIVVRTPWLTSAYFKDPEKTKELWAGGWLHTGDLAVVHENGYIFIVDREKDAVKSGGEFIPTLVIENVLSECSGVGEVAVVGYPHEKWGERPAAFIVKSEDLTEKQIYQCLEKYVEVGRIQKWWIPDKIIFIDAIPKTSTGKADKKELRKLL